MRRDYDDCVCQKSDLGVLTYAARPPCRNRLPLLRTTRREDLSLVLTSISSSVDELTVFGVVALLPTSGLEGDFSVFEVLSLLYRRRRIEMPLDPRSLLSRLAEAERSIPLQTRLARIAADSTVGNGSFFWQTAALTVPRPLGVLRMLFGQHGAFLGCLFRLIFFFDRIA